MNPVATLATTQTPENPATNAVDHAGNTFWVAPADNGEPVLVLTFGEQPVNLDKAIIQNGARDSFAQFSRAQKLHLVFNTGQDVGHQLEGRPGPTEGRHLERPRHHAGRDPHRVDLPGDRDPASAGGDLRDRALLARSSAKAL